jgi:hypothetical protein
VRREVAQVMSGGGTTLYYDLISSVVVRSTTYGGLVLGQVRNPLEVSFRFAWSPDASLPRSTPVSMPRSLSRGGCFLGRRFPCLIDGWPLVASGPPTMRSL